MLNPEEINILVLTTFIAQEIIFLANSKFIHIIILNLTENIRGQTKGGNGNIRLKLDSKNYQYQIGGCAGIACTIDNNDLM